MQFHPRRKMPQEDVHTPLRQPLNLYSIKPIPMDGGIVSQISLGVGHASIANGASNFD